MSAAPLTDAPPPSVASPAPSTQVPLGRKVAYGVGGLTENIIQNALLGLSLPIYNKGLGLSPELIGWALAIPRIFDAIVDPFIGSMSDNTRSRWGRRRPFLFVSAFLMAILFTVIWMPPRFLYDPRPATFFTLPGLFWFFMIISTLYYIAYACFAIPRGALMIEMTTDTHERTKLNAFSTFFAYVAALGIPWLYKLTFVFNPKNEVQGMHSVGLLCGLIILATALVPAIFCRERDERIDQPKVILLKAIRDTLHNGPFLLMSGLILFVLLGVSIANPLALYINIDYVCGGDKSLGATYGAIAGTIMSVASIVAVPIVARLGRTLGKRRTIMLGIVLSLVGFLLSWFTFTPQHPYWQVIPALFYATGLTAVWVLGGAILADICDLDELKHNLRREGMFGASFQFLNKAGVALIMIVSGYVIRLGGYQDGLAVQSDKTIYNLRLGYMFIPTVCLIICLILVKKLPITEESARKVRAILDARKANRASDVPPAVA